MLLIADFCHLVIDKDNRHLRALLAEYQDHLSALKDGRSFTPELTAPGRKSPKPKSESKSKKRKNARDGKQGSSKRRRSSEDSDQEGSLEFPSDSEEEEESDFGHTDEESEIEEDSDDDSEKDVDEGLDASSDVEIIEDVEADEVTEESLKEKIKITKEKLKAGRERLQESRKQKKIAVDGLIALKKNDAKTQREKNAFCSLKRSEVSQADLSHDCRLLMQ